MSIACAAACVALASVGGQAGSAPPPWVERASAYGHLSVTFRIEWIAVGRTGWSARLALRNWDIELAVHPRFALLASRLPNEHARVLPANEARPAVPAVLHVRGSWQGTISGPGRPAPGSFVRLRLGTFRAVIAPNLFITYTTRHAYRLR